jgi:hypothetical protein
MGEIPFGLAALLLALQTQGPPAQDWTRVLTLRPGDEVVVTTGDRAAMDAIFADASAERIRLLAFGSAAVDDALRTLLRASISAADLAAALDGRQLAAGEVTLGPRGLTSGGRMIATVGTVVREIARRDVDQVRRREDHRPAVSAGVSLIVAGAGMIGLNVIGLSSDRTTQPGSSRDGYLGTPGVVIGGSLVIAGGILLHRSHATRVIYRRPRS